MNRNDFERFASLDRGISLFTGGQIENISRKLDVDYILSGETPDIERIVSLCQAESIQKVQSGRRIGF